MEHFMAWTASSGMRRNASLAGPGGYGHGRSGVPTGLKPLSLRQGRGHPLDRLAGRAARAVQDQGDSTVEGAHRIGRIVRNLCEDVLLQDIVGVADVDRASHSGPVQ